MRTVEVQPVVMLFPELWERVERALAWQDSIPIDRHALRYDATVGKRTLWVAPDPYFPGRLSSVIVTVIVRHARSEPVLEVQLVAGRHIGTWISSAARTLGQYAQAFGCTRFHVICRKGWRHWCLKHFGLPVTWSESARADQQHSPNRRVHQH